MAIIRWRDPFSFVPRGFWHFPSLFEEEWPEINEGLNVYETDKDLVIEANVAGVPVDKVDVSVEGREITIDAKYEETEEEKKKKKVVYRAKRQADYHYHVFAPCPVVGGKAVAEVNDGVLTLRIPKTKETKGKRVKVKVKK